MDISFLLIQSIIFGAECLMYLTNQKNEDIQEEKEIMDEIINDDFETGHDKNLFIIKSIITKVFTAIIVIRVVLHLIGFQNI